MTTDKHIWIRPAGWGRGGLTLLLALGLILSGCDKGAGEGIPTGPAPTVDNLIERGWERFEAGEYASAEDLFAEASQRDAASAGAYLGLGWSRNHLGEYGAAVLAHKLVLVLAQGTSIATDSKAGLLVAYSVTDKDSLAILWGERVLADAPDYQFQHNGAITAATVRLIMAQSHFRLGQYFLAQQQVELLDPQFLDGLTTQTAVSSPLKVQERVAGQPMVVDSVRAGEFTNNLVAVTSVDQVVGGGTFEVLSTSKRWTDLNPKEDVITNGWEVTIKLAPDPLLIPGTEIVITYLHVPDYSRYLAALLTTIQSLRGGS